MADEQYIIKIPAIEIKVTKGTSTNTDTDIFVDEFASVPDLTIDNRNSNGDVVVPFTYNKNKWNIVYNLDISDRKMKGMFVFKINCLASFKNLVPQVFLYFQNKIGGFQEIQLYDYLNQAEYMTLDKMHTFNVKQRMTAMGLPYDISTWLPANGIPESYIYLKTTDTNSFHYSNGFRIFNKDDRGDYIRV